MQVDVFYLFWDFIKGSRVFVALSVNTAAFCGEAGVALSEKSQVQLHESCHYRVQILLLVTHKSRHHLVALLIQGFELITRIVKLRYVA